MFIQNKQLPIRLGGQSSRFTGSHIKYHIQTGRWDIILEVNDEKLPPFLPYLISSIILSVTGLVGLYILIDMTVPTLGPRWLFFFLLTCAASGLALPVAYFFNWRFPSATRVKPGVIVRQAIWAGVYLDLLVWFQLGRVLSLPLGVALAAGLAAIEFALRLAERSRFAPKEPQNE